MSSLSILSASACHRFANLHGYMGMGQAGAGAGPTQDTCMKPTPIQWIWQVFSRYISCILIAILHFFLNHFTTKIPETPSEPVQVHGYGLDGYGFHMGACMGRGRVTCGLPMMCTIFCQEM